eukprot:4505185-Karenia_brevis.AAC.1
MARPKFHPDLLCNFDQTWCTKLTPQNTMLSVEDTVKDPLSRYAVRRSIMGALQDYLDGLPH